MNTDVTVEVDGVGEIARDDVIMFEDRSLDGFFEAFCPSTGDALLNEGRVHWIREYEYLDEHEVYVYPRYGTYVSDVPIPPRRIRGRLDRDENPHWSEDTDGRVGGTPSTWDCILSLIPWRQG